MMAGSLRWWHYGPLMRVFQAKGHGNYTSARSWEDSVPSVSERGPFCQKGLMLTREWIDNNINYKV